MGKIKFKILILSLLLIFFCTGYSFNTSAFSIIQLQKLKILIKICIVCFIIIIIILLILHIKKVNKIAKKHKKIRQRIHINSEISLAEEKLLIAKSKISHHSINELNKFINNALYRLKILLSKEEMNFENNYKIIEDTISKIYILSSIQCKTFKLKPVKTDINNILNKLIDNIKQESLSKEIFIKKDLSKKPLIVYVDCTYIKDALFEIIKNSMDYQKKDGIIKITSEYLQNNFCLIKIEDNGIGIKKNLLEYMLINYCTFSDTLTEKSGIGLGLKYAYEIIKQHNGKIELNGDTKKGLCVSIFIPLMDNFI